MDPADFAIEFIGGGDDVAPRGALAVAPKDPTISSLIPETISECAIWVGDKGTHCASDPVMAAIVEKFSLSGDDPVEEAKEKLGCKTERCVVERVAGTVPGAARDLATRFKVKGSRGNALLSNTQIDAVMRQFGAQFPDFFPFNFNMKDYASNSFRSGEVVHKPDTLATIQWSDLVAGNVNGVKYTRCGCVINTDVYDGPGKHWMALFADASTATVEFFNSSGNAPGPEWINWLVKTKSQMEAGAAGGGGPTPTIIRVTSIRHQKSKSECGVYSLFYIWARLNGVPASYFSQRPVPDQYMFEFRQHIFDDPTMPVQDGAKFSWGDFAARVKLKWERS